MTHVDMLCQRYDASTSLIRYGVEVVAVADHAGARFNLTFRRLIAAIHEDGPGLWDDLVAASKLLRWRLITQPQPVMFNQGLTELVGEVSRQAYLLRGAVADQDLLDEIAASATALVNQERESAVGKELLRTCLEAGADTCVVITARKPAQLGLTSWLKRYGITVISVGEIERSNPNREQAYVVGPPRFFPAHLTTAPVTDAVTFILPAWLRDRNLPCSTIAPYAEGAIRVKSREYTVGDTFEGDTFEMELSVPIEAEEEEGYLPKPVWEARKSEEREPANNEVVARKILLSGNWAIWLDNGERIRSLDPQQPNSERVTYTDVEAVCEGTYLLLRKDVAERGVLYQTALDRLGPEATAVEATQEEWKRVLTQRLQQQGYRQVAKDLHTIGVKSADQARAWTDPSLIRPNSDRDFKVLLKWLDIPIQPTFDHASLLRKRLRRASVEIRKQLETAVSAADLTELESTGHLSLDLPFHGIRGILATRVVAISPYSEIVPRHEARLPFEDRSAKWLE